MNEIADATKKVQPRRCLRPPRPAKAIVKPTYRLPAAPFLAR
jgi:hypothetical protein